MGGFITAGLGGRAGPTASGTGDLASRAGTGIGAELSSPCFGRGGRFGGEVMSPGLSIDTPLDKEAMRALGIGLANLSVLVSCGPRGDGTPAGFPDLPPMSGRVPMGSGLVDVSRSDDASGCASDSSVLSDNADFF